MKRHRLLVELWRFVCERNVISGAVRCVVFWHACRPSRTYHRLLHTHGDTCTCVSIPVRHIRCEKCAADGSSHLRFWLSKADRSPLPVHQVPPWRPVSSAATASFEADAAALFERASRRERRTNVPLRLLTSRGVSYQSVRNGVCAA